MELSACEHLGHPKTSPVISYQSFTYCVCRVSISCFECRLGTLPLCDLLVPSIQIDASSRSGIRLDNGFFVCLDKKPLLTSSFAIFILIMIFNLRFVFSHSSTKENIMSAPLPGLGGGEAYVKYCRIFRPDSASGRKYHLFDCYTRHE